MSGFIGGAIPPRPDRTAVECKSGCDHDRLHGMCRGHGEPIRHRIDEPPTCDCPPRRTALQDAAAKVAAISAWVDAANADRGEALTWHRVAKVAEESGEALTELLGVTGQNPRKGVYSTNEKLIEELLDVAVAALGAVEHVTGNRALSTILLTDKIDRVHQRAGLETP